MPNVNPTIRGLVADDHPLVRMGLAAIINEQPAMPAVGARLAERVTSESLTDRELEVLRLMARGGTNDSLAAALGVRTGTVKWHVTHIMEKLGATDRTMAVSIALQRGIIHID